MVKQHSRRLVLALAVGLCAASGATAATVNVAIAPAFQQEAVVSGSIASGGSYATNVAWNSGGESRAIYEFKLPTLPTGATLSGASFDYNVAQTTSTSTSASQFQFTPYAGNGFYDAADDGRTNGGLYSPLLYSPGHYSQSLPVASVASLAKPWLGVNVWQERYNFQSGIARDSLGGGAPALNLVASAPDVGTLNVIPAVDAKASTSGGVTSVTDGDYAINTQLYPPADVDRRGILEYDLRGLPAGARITGATATFDVESVTVSTGPGSTGGPEPRIYAYAGDGVATPADAARTGSLAATGAEVTTTGDGYAVTLDAATLNVALAGGNGVLGLLVRGSADGQQFGFATTEGKDQLGAGYEPVRLSISYAVPEPTSIAALAAAAAVGAGRRRRRA